MRRLRLAILSEAVRTQTHILTTDPAVSGQPPSLKAHLSGLCMGPSFILVRGGCFSEWPVCGPLHPKTSARAEAYERLGIPCPWSRGGLEAWEIGRDETTGISSKSYIAARLCRRVVYLELHVLVIHVCMHAEPCSDNTGLMELTGLAAWSLLRATDH